MLTLRHLRACLVRIAVSCISWPADGSPHSLALAGSARENAVAAVLRAQSGDPGALRAFLLRMPKGGELHIHSWGTALAEDDLRWGRERGFCATSSHPVSLIPPPCARSDVVPLSQSLDPTLYADLVGALSENAETGAIVSRHDHFFATFWVAAPVITRALADELALLRTTEAKQSASYVEFMSNPDAVEAFGQRAQSLPFDPDHLERAFDALAPFLPDMLRQSRSQMEDRLRTVDHMQGCDAARVPRPAPCAVTVRFLATVMRTEKPAYVFGEMMAAFAVVHGYPRYVGVNILGPEDDPVAVGDYNLHMRMFRFLSQHYPDVHLALHAGELTPAVAAPPALAFHVRGAVEAGASRIGHGIDITGETDAGRTLAIMARRGVALEANLSANAVILGVVGAAHPLHRYLAAGVPVVLSTDDPGVLRTDLTREYQRAVREQDLDYHQLKLIARNALQYSFLPGRSLWRDGVPGRRVHVCAENLPATAKPTNPACAALLGESLKATLQWRLERDLDRFENTILAQSALGNK